MTVHSSPNSSHRALKTTSSAVISYERASAHPTYRYMTHGHSVWEVSISSSKDFYSVFAQQSLGPHVPLPGASCVFPRGPQCPLRGPGPLHRDTEGLQVNSRLPGSRHRTDQRPNQLSPASLSSSERPGLNALDLGMAPGLSCGPKVLTQVLLKTTLLVICLDISMFPKQVSYWASGRRQGRNLNSGIFQLCGLEQAHSSKSLFSQHTEGKNMAHPRRPVVSNS